MILIVGYTLPDGLTNAEEEFGTVAEATEWFGTEEGHGPEIDRFVADGEMFITFDDGFSIGIRHK